MRSSNKKMSGHGEIDEQIERLRKGNTLPENEVKALCEKVSKKFKKERGFDSTPVYFPMLM